LLKQLVFLGKVWLETQVLTVMSLKMTPIIHKKWISKNY
jgi:hypothetical protein